MYIVCSLVYVTMNTDDHNESFLTGDLGRFVLFTRCQRYMYAGHFMNLKFTLGCTV